MTIYVKSLTVKCLSYEYLMTISETSTGDVLQEKIFLEIS